MAMTRKQKLRLERNVMIEKKKRLWRRRRRKKKVRDIFFFGPYMKVNGNSFKVFFSCRNKKAYSIQ